MSHYTDTANALQKATDALTKAEETEPTYQASALIQMAEAWAAIAHVHALLSIHPVMTTQYDYTD